MIYERWVCNRCGAPCFVEIHHTDKGLHEGICGEAKFRKQICVAKEPVIPEWVRIDSGAELSGEEEQQRIVSKKFKCCKCGKKLNGK